MKHMQRLAIWAGALTSVVILAFSLPIASAQSEGPDIARASLRLWPEYDDPGLLVIFAGDFSDPTSFPRDVSFPLPAGARNVQAAYPDASGSLLIAQAETNANQVTYKQLPVAAFHLEYYLDRQPSGAQREIRYQFQAPYPIAVLEVSVQQPERATDFSLTPAAETSFVGEDGLTYFVFNRANLAAGDTLEIMLRYTKTDSGVSRPQLAVTNRGTPPAAKAAPATVSSAAGSGLGTWLPWALIGVGGALLMALTLYWLLWQRGSAARETRIPPVSTGALKRPAGAAVASTPVGKAAFCTQCGHPFRPDDRFCAQCGAPRRG
ncbi:MAG: zinc ribbon domain-containing protein [Anaerolineae bacterium]